MFDSIQNDYSDVIIAVLHICDYVAGYMRDLITAVVYYKLDSKSRFKDELIEVYFCKSQDQNT